MVGIETLATVGLGLDAAGALMVVLPEFEQFRAYKTPEDEIQQIEQGRVTLLSEGKLTSDDSGFEAVCEALDGRVEVHGPIKEIVVVSLEDEPDAVEVRYHTDGDSIHARDGRISRHSSIDISNATFTSLNSGPASGIFGLAVLSSYSASCSRLLRLSCDICSR